MKTSQGGLEFIGRWEGLRLSAYQDIVGVWTIAYGHVILPHESFPGPITRMQALDLLAGDVGKCDRAIATCIKVPLTQNQWDALASWSFNVGVGPLSNSTLATRLNAGHHDEVPALLLAWDKAGGKPNAGLLARRRSEGTLWSLQAPPAGADDDWHLEAEKAYAICFDLYDVETDGMPTRDERKPA